MKEGGLRTKGIEKKSSLNKPLISILTVVYNGENTIEETIRSVINQKYDNIEYIIIDGESTDKTLDIIKKYDSNIDYWISEKDNGIYDAMNKAVSYARGNYISILNSDDWLCEDSISIVVESIISYNYDIYCGYEFMWNDKNEIVNVFGCSDFFLNKQCIAHETCFIKKDIYENYTYNTYYKSAADYDFLNLIKKNGYSFKFIPKPLVNFRLGGMSDSYIGMYETVKIKYKYGYISFANYLLHIMYYKIRIICKG